MIKFNSTEAVPLVDIEILRICHRLKLREKTIIQMKKKPLQLKLNPKRKKFLKVPT